MFAAIRSAIGECGEYRLGRHGSFWHRFALAPWRWSLAVCKFEDHWSLHLFCLWVTLRAPRVEPRDLMESWGLNYDREFSSLHLDWGDRTKIVRVPWSYDHCRTEVMLDDGRFVSYEKCWRRGQVEPTPEPPGRYRQTFRYHYTLDSGETQHVDATVTVERRSWCWRARPFRWLRWPRLVRTSIDVKFSESVGEGRGSYKGGVLGCYWDLLPGESPYEALRRMEAERKFTR